MVLVSQRQWTAGELLVSDDNSGGNLNAMIVFRATQSGTYYLEAGANQDLTLGGYRVSARLATGDDFTGSGTSDITFMPSVVDVAGINRISRRIYATAAGAILGHLKGSSRAVRKRVSRKPGSLMALGERGQDTVSRRQECQ